MKVCFDTSVLVAALVGGHPHHFQAFLRLKEAMAKRTAGVLTTHALAETFATLTALPLKPKLSPAEAGRLIEVNIDPHFQIIHLTPTIYSAAIALTIQRGLGSGAIYDALHLEGARAAGCDQILTFNLKHFRSLAPQDPMVVCP